MGMSLDNFLVLNGLFVTGMILWLLLLKGNQKQPTRLNLRKDTPLAKPEDGLDIGGEQELTVHFNYNGHSWDAYEILGVPAGSPPEVIEEAYKTSRAKMEEGSEEILDLAYQALQKRR